MSDTGPVKNHLDAYNDLLSDIYEEIGGDTETFPPVKEAFRDFFDASQQDSLLRLISLAAINERIPDLIVGAAFRKFLADGANCHPKSVLYKVRRQVAEIESADSIQDRHRMWREFIDSYVDTVEDVSFLVSTSPKYGTVQMPLQRKIISAGRRSQIYAREMENALNNYFELDDGENASPEIEILIAQLAVAHRLSRYVLNAVNTLPSLNLLRSRSSIDENRFHRLILQMEWIRFNNPFNWIRQVYVGATNERSIGVKVSIPKEPPDIEPVNPQLVRNIIDRIILAAAHSAQTAGSYEISFSWDHASRELHIASPRLKDLINSEPWKEVEPFMGGLRTRWGVSLDDNGHNSPHIFIEIILIEDPPIPEGKGGMRRGPGDENIPIGEIQRGSSISSPALLGAGLYNGSMNMPFIMPFQPQIMANTPVSTLFIN